MDADRASLFRKLEEIEVTPGERKVMHEMIECMFIEYSCNPLSVSSFLFLGYLAVLANEGTLTFDFDLENDPEYEEDALSHDPTISKYNLTQMEDIVDCHFSKRWKFQTIQHKYNKLKSIQEIYR